MTVVNRFQRWLCQLICGGQRFAPHDIPFEIREASHNMAAAATEVQASVHRLRKEVDVFQAIAESMKGTRDVE